MKNSFLRENQRDVEVLQGCSGWAYKRQMGTLGRLRDDLGQLVSQQKTTNVLGPIFWSGGHLDSGGKEMAVYLHNNVICESESGHLKKFMRST